MGESSKVWISRDNKIKKVILKTGVDGLKPTENCDCIVHVTQCDSDVEIRNPYRIGMGENSLERSLDKVLLFMNVKEVATVTMQIEKEKHLNFTLELEEFKSNGLIYEWNAKQKYDLAMEHKIKGNELFEQHRYVDASYHFGKGVKLLASIPIEIEYVPITIDGIRIVEIMSLKLNLLNNLASCYMRHNDYEQVIDLCKKILNIDVTNVKALYKLAVAYDHLRDFHSSYDTLDTLLMFDPKNKAAIDKIKAVSVKVKQTNDRVNNMFKNMVKDYN